MAASKAPRLMAANVVKEVEGVGNWAKLGNWLFIPVSTLTDIHQRHPDDRGRLGALITLWLKVNPAPTWRKVITTLYEMREHETADRIRQYAEPLADPTLTFDAVLTAVAPVRDWEGLGRNLGVPGPRCTWIRIDSKFPTDEKKKEATMYHWLRYCPGVSWGKLAGELYYMEEKQSLQLVQRHLKKTAEPTLTLPNLCQALAKVEDWYGVGRLLCVPNSKRDEIKAKYPDSAEAKRQMLDRFLTSHPAPSWRVVFEGLYMRGLDDVKYHTILQDARRRYGRDLPLIFSDLLLTILDSKDLDEQRSTVSSANTALAVLFPHHPRDGTFSALVTFLLSSGNRYPTPWMIHYTDGSPTCLCRNCVKLTIPECAGSVTLINSSVFFEAHVNAPGPWLRFYIREAIFTGAAAILNCEKNPAIVCPCKVGDSHVATVKPDRELWICKKNPEKWGALQHSHKEWFESTGPQQPTPPKTDAEGPSSAPATINLYGQTYEQIVTKALAGSSKNFQLVNPKENWTWAPASAGFINPQAYRFVGQVPTWSAVGTYEPSGKDMHQAYLQVLSLRNVIGEGRNADQVREAREQMTRAQNTFVQDHQKANEGYAQYKKTLPTDTPVDSYDTWIAMFWKGRLDADKLAYEKALETMVLVIDQKNTGLKDAIDAATAPKDHTDPKPGFLKVQIRTTIGVRPAYVFEDPKEWADRVTTQGGGDSLKIELSASASSSSLSQSWAGVSTGLDDGFFSTCGSGGWQMMDLVEDKTMKVSITIKAFSLFEVGPDKSWYDSGLLKRLATEDNWNPPYSTKGGADKKPVFGKGGVLPLVLTGLIAGFQPSIDITMSDATYSKYKQLWDASSGVRVGPFQIGGSGSRSDESWSKNTDNKTFHVESKANYPFIMGITVANPGE